MKMNLMLFKTTFLPVFLAIAVQGCASGAKKRIDENPDMFHKLTPEQQLQVQGDAIETGYTKDMVYLSQGEPTEKKKVTSKQGKSIEVWVYNKRKPEVYDPPKRTDPGPGFQGAFSGPNWSGGPSRATPMFYSDRGFEVEFENGKVSSVKDR